MYLKLNNYKEFLQEKENFINSNTEYVKELKRYLNIYNQYKSNKDILKIQRRNYLDSIQNLSIYKKVVEKDIQFSFKEEEIERIEKIIKKYDRKIYHFEIDENQFNLLYKTFNKKSESLPTVKEIKKALGQDSSYSWCFRDVYIQYNFAVLTEDLILETIEQIKENGYKSVLEINAGRGLFSYWLNKYIKKDKDLNINVKATDLFKDYFKENNTFYEIEKRDAINITKDLKKDTLVVSSWPSLNSNFLTYSLANLKKDKNQGLLFIGESGGCTGDESFCDFTDNYCEQNYNSFKNKHYNFSGIWDVPILIKKEKEFSKLDVNKYFGIPETEGLNNNMFI